MFLASLLCGVLAVAYLQDPASVLELACTRYAETDLDADGEYEIERLRLAGPLAGVDAERPLVLVIVEERLLAPPQAGADLVPALDTYVQDLAREGYCAAAIGAKVYSGPRHQDGLTVLAIREFLRHVWRELPALRAVVLVGAFPDAFLVRQYNWWKHGQITLNAGKEGERSYGEDAGIDYLASIPEPVALRCDLVLGDMDGRWEEVYHREREELPHLIAAFPDGRLSAGRGADAIEEGTTAYEDFFFVNDGRYSVHYRTNGRPVISCIAEGDDECSPADLLSPNPIAKPELWVSRLDARHASVVPDPTVTDKHGRHLLDECGNPQVLEFATPEETPHPHAIWVPSEAAERNMLADWFGRRHRFSLGEMADERRPASIGTGWGSAMPSMKAAFPEWAEFSDEGYEVVREDTNLAEVVDWLKRPAVVRSVKAHGDPWGCEWAPAPDTSALDRAAGPAIWNWARESCTLRPTLAATAHKLDFAVTRSLYESGSLPDGPAVWLYTACMGMSPSHGAELPYNDPRYGWWQGAECLLMHCRGLAIIGRSKVFYDEPTGMWDVLGSGGTPGDVWRHYFDTEADDPVLFADNGIGRKRAYFWCVVGDCTARVAAPR